MEHSIESRRFYFEIRNYCRMSAHPYEKSIALAFVAYCQEIEEENKINDNVCYFLREFVNDDDNNFVEQIKCLPSDLLANYILNADYEVQHFNSFDMQTPESISQLAIGLLDIKPNESVIDGCMGYGDFLSDAYIKEPAALYTGVDINTTTSAIASIRAFVKGEKINIINSSILTDCCDQKKFDKVFCDFPFGMRTRFVNMDFDSSEEPLPLKGGATADWVFIYRAVTLMKKTGKAVVVTSLGALWNTLDKHNREMFIRAGFIEGVIVLPQKLYSATSINTAIVVLSNNNNVINFVNAKELFSAGRRQNVLAEKDIQTILVSYGRTTNISNQISIDEIIRNGCSLDPIRYLTVKEEIPNGVEFKELITNITRGASISANELDEMTSIQPTDYQYLMLANIKDGVISNDLPYLTGIDKKMEKYCIKDGDLILSKNGYPFKVAVANVPEGKKILASGNLFKITLDTNKVNPYYVKAFLESDIGISELKSISVGTIISNIGVTQLNTIKIPLLSMEQQNKIATRYQVTLDEIALLKRKTEKALNSLRTIFSFDEED